jgi:DNA-binding NarL/FixJ family response regulator
VAAALGAGAAGFVLKDARGEDIVRATVTVASGDSWLDPQVTGRVLDTYRGRWEFTA